MNINNLFFIIIAVAGGVNAADQAGSSRMSMEAFLENNTKILIQRYSEELCTLQDWIRGQEELALYCRKSFVPKQKALGVVRTRTIGKKSRQDLPSSRSYEEDTQRLNNILREAEEKLAQYKIKEAFIKGNIEYLNTFLTRQKEAAMVAGMKVLNINN